MRSHSAVGLLVVALAAAGCGDADVLVSGAEAELDDVFGELGGCNEGNCRCFTELAKAMDGRSPDMGIVSGHLGNSDPAQIFANGGSENIPLTCRTVKYLVDSDPAWLDRFFRVQLDPGRPEVYGGEIFSSTYSALAIGDALAAHAHARREGHRQLEDVLGRWLRATWAALALGAVDGRVTSRVAHNVHGTLSDRVDLPGYNLGLVGTRSYVNGHGGQANGVTGSGLLGVLLDLALEHPARRFGPSLDNSPGYYGGLRAAVLATGHRLDGSGRVNLGSRSVPPEDVGLTSAQREGLVRFLRSGGTQGFDAVTALLTGVELACDLTVIRTERGVLSWWGDSLSTSRPCNARKGGSWALSRLEAGAAEFVTRSSDKWGGGDMGSVWRSGSQVCARSSTLPELCLQLPGGAIVAEAQLGRHGGLRCVSGACGGPAPPPPPPPPPQGVDDAASVWLDAPARVAPGATFSISVTMRNTGTSTWTREGAFRLGSQSPQDNLTWSVGRVLLPAGTAVAPGREHTFTATLTAPAAAGTYPLQWQMVHEQVQWFGAKTGARTIAVAP